MSRAINYLVWDQFFDRPCLGCGLSSLSQSISWPVCSCKNVSRQSTPCGQLSIWESQSYWSQPVANTMVWWWFWRCATYHLPLWWHDKLWCLKWYEYWWWCMCCEDDVISVEGSGGLLFNQVSSAAVIRDCRALHWRWVASGCETKTRHRVCQKIKITKETRPRFSTSCVFVFIPLF